MQRDAVKAGEATKYEAADTTVPAHAPPVRVGSLESLPTWLNVPGLLDSSTACADDEAGSIKTGAASPCTQMCPITLSVNVLVGQSATPNAVSHFAADSDETTQSTILSDNCQQGRDQNVSSTGGSLFTSAPGLPRTSSLLNVIHRCEGRKRFYHYVPNYQAWTHLPSR